MSDPSTPCSAFESVDLAAYVIEPEASEWARFREHFPTCDECTAALQSWSELEWDLAEVGVGLGSHPTLDELDRYAGGVRPGEATLMASERTRIETHLTECTTCADELRALEGFAASSPGAAPTHAAADAPATSIWDPLRDFFQSLELVPTLSVAAAALLVGWWFLSSGGIAPKQDTGPQIVDTIETKPRPEPAPEALPSPRESAQPKVDPSELAQSQPERVDDDAPQLAAVDPKSVPTPETDPVRPKTPRSEPRTTPTPVEQPAPTATPESPPYEVLIASLDLDHALAFRGRDGIAGAGRMDLIGRSATASAAETVQVIAPAQQVGLSKTSAPLLLWSLPKNEAHAVEIQIVDERKIDPVLRLTLAGPHEAGLHGLDLAARGIELDPGVSYIWSVAILADPDRPTRNPRSRATLTIAPRLVETPSKPATGQSLRETLVEGYWYDGVAELARARTTHPDSDSLARALSGLLAGEAVTAHPGMRVEIH